MGSFDPKITKKTEQVDKYIPFFPTLLSPLKGVYGIGNTEFFIGVRGCTIAIVPPWVGGVGGLEVAGNSSQRSVGVAQPGVCIRLGIRIDYSCDDI